MCMKPSLPKKEKHETALKWEKVLMRLGTRIYMINKSAISSIDQYFVWNNAKNQVNVVEIIYII